MMAGRCMCGFLMADMPKNHTCPDAVVSEAITTNQPSKVAGEKIMSVTGQMMEDEWDKGFAAGKAAGQIEGIDGQQFQFTGDADFDDLFNRCREVLKVKGSDYTSGKGTPGSNRADRLANFYTAARAFGININVFTVWWVYFFKHLSAIVTFIQVGKVESEPIKERIVDAINYLGLLHKLILHEQEQEKQL
jgi:hypothetical protein